jgi:hypothetical protein
MFCVHKYLTKCKTNPQPPGFADFLRGTITLFKYCKYYDFKLMIDNSHPIFEFLEPNENFVTDSNTITCELIPCQRGGYEYIDAGLNLLFQNKKSFSVLTNGFYSKNNGILTNWGEVETDCKKFIRSILVPLPKLQEKIDLVLNSLFSKNESYDVIHVRFGDQYLHEQGLFEQSLCKNVETKILSKIKQMNKNIIFLADSKAMALNIVNQITELKYWDNEKIHIGDLRNYSNRSIEDTLIDFFIMSRATTIYYLNHSGFSQVVSCIFDVPYLQL